MSAKRSTAARGPSQRQLRVGELMRRTLADVLARGDIHDPELARLSITVSEVQASPDLKVATVHVMPLGGEEQDTALAALRRNAGTLRRLVTREMTLKYAPELRFRIDQTFARMDATRRLLDSPEVRRDLDDGAPPDDAQG